MGKGTGNTPNEDFLIREYMGFTAGQRVRVIADDEDGLSLGDEGTISFANAGSDGRGHRSVVTAILVDGFEDPVEVPPFNLERIICTGTPAVVEEEKPLDTFTAQSRGSSAFNGLNMDRVDYQDIEDWLKNHGWEPSPTLVPGGRAQHPHQAEFYVQNAQDPADSEEYPLPRVLILRERSFNDYATHQENAIATIAGAMNRNALHILEEMGYDRARLTDY
jgi:hypothetical protein